MCATCPTPPPPNNTSPHPPPLPSFLPPSLPQTLPAPTHQRLPLPCPAANAFPIAAVTPPPSDLFYSTTAIVNIVVLTAVMGAWPWDSSPVASALRLSFAYQGSTALTAAAATFTARRTRGVYFVLPYLTLLSAPLSCYCFGLRSPFFYFATAAESAFPSPALNPSPHSPTHPLTLLPSPLRSLRSRTAVNAFWRLVGQQQAGSSKQRRGSAVRFSHYTWWQQFGRLRMWSNVHATRMLPASYMGPARRDLARQLLLAGAIAAVGGAAGVIVLLQTGSYLYRDLALFLAFFLFKDAYEGAARAPLPSELTPALPAGTPAASCWPSGPRRTARRCSCRPCLAASGAWARPSRRWRASPCSGAPSGTEPSPSPCARGCTCRSSRPASPGPWPPCWPFP